MSSSDDSWKEEEGGSVQRLQQDNKELKLEADEVEAENVALQQQVERMREKHETEQREMIDEMERLHASITNAGGSKKKAMAGGEQKRASQEYPLNKKNTADRQQSLEGVGPRQSRIPAEHGCGTALTAQ